MDWKKLALSGVMAGSLLGGIGCGESGIVFPARDNVCASGETAPCMTTTPAAEESARTAEVPATMEDTTAVWVLSVASLPEANAGGQAAGFNLDGIDSGADGSGADDADCQEFTPDFTGLFDPAHRGVDNALQGLVGTIEGFLDRDDCGGDTAGCLDRTLQQQINEGGIILMMEVSGINDYTTDDQVTLQLVQGTLGGDAMPETTPAGELAPGQTFMRMENLGAAVQGDIFQGRLRAIAGSLTIPINVGDFMLPLVISDPQIRFNVAADGSTLNNGVIGGSIRVEDIVNAVTQIDPSLVDTVRSAIGSLADVTPSAGNPQECEALSVGLTFSAVNASLSN